MHILIDTREIDALSFSNIPTEVVTLNVGDYTAKFSDGTFDKSIVERKSLSDLFSSFTHNYDNEKAKIVRAKNLGLRYILGIEATAWEVRRGHSFWKNGEEHEVKKSGISQVRQIMTLHKRGDLDEVWWCNGRIDMAFRIQEYFLAQERINSKK